jgi:hypothetical protein
VRVRVRVRVRACVWICVSVRACICALSICCATLCCAVTHLLNVRDSLCALFNRVAGGFLLTLGQHLIVLMTLQQAASLGVPTVLVTSHRRDLGGDPSYFYYDGGCVTFLLSEFKPPCCLRALCSLSRLYQ